MPEMVKVNDRAHTDDFRDVMLAAEEAITAAMQDGQSRYAAGDWRTHSNGRPPGSCGCALGRLAQH